GQEWSPEDQRDIIILGKGTIFGNPFLCRDANTAYGPYSIRRISDKSAVAVEIDFTWSLEFVLVELGRLPKPLSCSTLLIYPIYSSKVLIDAPLFLIATSVEARISLMMFKFSSCLLADSTINLDNDSSIVSLRAEYEEFPSLHW
ncbi:hypothetical protein Tco_0404315, partial [Tanacetum coccineum]